MIFPQLILEGGKQVGVGFANTSLSYPTSYSPVIQGSGGRGVGVSFFYRVLSYTGNTPTLKLIERFIYYHYFNSFMIEKKTIKCTHCNNIWDTKSKKKFVTCPDCLRKVLNVEYQSVQTTK